jgi:hypothetical protein
MLVYLIVILSSCIIGEDKIIIEMLKDIVKKIDNIEAEMKEMKEKFNEIEEEMKENFKKYTGEYSLKLAKSSLVSITISPATPLNNTSGCGSVVEINEKWYIATAAHIIIKEKEKENCTRTVVKITDVNENDISYSPYALVYKKNEIDVALIPVTNIKKIGTIKPLKVPEKIIEIPSTIISLTIRDKNLVSQFCNIVEIETDRLITNCGGTHGYSGSPYLTLNGEFIGIHQVQGPLPHLNGDKESVGKTMLNHFISECWNVNKYFSNECQEEYINILNLHSRNPRCTIVPTSFLRNLLNNSIADKIEFGTCEENEKDL